MVTSLQIPRVEKYFVLYLILKKISSTFRHRASEFPGDFVQSTVVHDYSLSYITLWNYNDECTDQLDLLLHITLAVRSFSISSFTHW